MDGYPGMVLPGFFPDLVLSGRLPWHGFVWQEFLPFQFLASRGIIQDEFVGQSFSGTGCRAATSAGCILRCLNPNITQGLIIYIPWKFSSNWSKLKLRVSMPVTYRNQNIEKMFDLFAFYFPKPALAVQTTFSIASHQVCLKPRIVYLFIRSVQNLE